MSEENKLDLSCCDNPVRNKFTSTGQKENVALSVEEDIWPVAGPYPFNAVNENCRIFSDNVGDTAAGAGAQLIKLTGLSNGLLVTETVALNGTTPVNLVNQYNRIFNGEVSRAGSNETNLGIINIQQTTSFLVLGQMDPATGNFLNAIFTVPTNWSPLKLIKFAGSFECDNASAPIGRIFLKYKPGSTGGWTTLSTMSISTSGNNPFNFNDPTETESFLFLPNYDIKMSVFTNASPAVGINKAYASFTIKET